METLKKHNLDGENSNLDTFKTVIKKCEKVCAKSAKIAKLWEKKIDMH